MSEPILIIDFDPSGLEATRSSLRAAGMPSAVAGSPRAFSLAMRTTVPEIVVLEPVLPGLDGFRVCEVLKKGVGGRVPMVVLASRQVAEEMFGMRGRLAGADWILELPRDEPELIAVCRDTIGPLPELIDTPAPDPPSPARVSSTPPAPPRPVRAARETNRLEDLGEADVDRIIESAFSGATQAAPVDGPDVPARLAPRKIAPPSARREPPIFDVLDVPGVRAPAKRLDSSDRLFSDAGPALDPGSTIPLARVPGLDLRAQPAPPDATPHPRPPARAKPDPSSSDSARPGRSIIRPILMTGFVLGAGAAGYWSWSPATAEATAGLNGGATEVTPTFKPLRAVSEVAEHEDSTPAVPAAAAAAPEPAVEDSTSAEPVPATATPNDVVANEPTDGEVVTTIPAQPLVPVLKPPVSTPPPLDVPNRSLPEPIAGTQIDPLYPAAARDAGLAGRVRMAVTVAPDGSVADINVLEDSQPGAGFGSAAVAAVRQWRFRPAVRNGEPHAATVEISLAFNPPTER